MSPKRSAEKIAVTKEAAKRQKTEQRRLRKRIVNMTPEQIEQQRLRKRIVTMTPEQIERQRLKKRNVNMQSKICAALHSADILEANINAHNCGPMSVICQYCHAKHFVAEQSADKNFMQCCHKGKVILDPIKSAPVIEQLMKGHHEHSKNFMKHIRSINSSLAFASMGANIAPPPGYGPYCFRINGQIYHRTGALHPVNEDQRKFAQLYILDPDEAADQRMLIKENAQCIPSLMQELSKFMHENNPFASAWSLSARTSLRSRTTLCGYFQSPAIRRRKNKNRPRKKTGTAN